MTMYICTNQSIEDRRLIIKFEYSPERVNRIRTISGRKWHNNKKYWTIPLHAETIKKLFIVFEDEEFCIEEDAQKVLLQLNLFPNADLRYDDVLRRCEEELKLHGYSSKTLKAYLGHIRRFLLYNQKNIEDLSVCASANSPKADGIACP